MTKREVVAELDKQARELGFVSYVDAIEYGSYVGHIEKDKVYLYKKIEP